MEKKEWQIPQLEVLNVKMTMSGKKPGHGHGGSHGSHDSNPSDPSTGFES